MGKFELLHRRNQHLRQEGLLRTYTEVELSPRPARAFIGGREVLMFTTTDYLGLARDGTIKAAMASALERYGCGSGGSRYLGGTTALHHQVERGLAQFHGQEQGVFYSNGYMANLGTVSALAREDDVIFSDADIHASVIDGCRLSRAAVRVWRHSDVQHLRKLLRDTDCRGQRILIFESLYSMGGDFAPVRDILAVAREFDCITFIDEIHAVGLYGAQGRGYADELQIAPAELDVFMAGTSKTFGMLGGYVAASDVVATAIKSQARSFIFTTAVPPLILAAILKVLDVIRGADAPRARLRRNMATLRKLLDDQGFDYLDSRSHIFPVMTGSTECTKRTCEALLARGIFAQGAIYPSVPQGRGRLRVTVLPQHTEDDLQLFVKALVAVRDSVEGFGIAQEA